MSTHSDIKADSERGKSNISRRDFLQYSAVLAGVTVQLPLTNHEESIQHNDQTSFWYQQPLRILQTVLRETDAKSYDVKKQSCSSTQAILY